jgi:hypothetical protein
MSSPTVVFTKGELRRFRVSKMDFRVPILIGGFSGLQAIARKGFCENDELSHEGC